MKIKLNFLPKITRFLLLKNIQLQLLHTHKNKLITGYLILEPGLEVNS